MDNYRETITSWAIKDYLIDPTGGQANPRSLSGARYAG